MQYNILVTGADGQLGTSLRKIHAGYPDYRIFFTDVGELDITDAGAVEKFVNREKIGCIINAAAYTAVDKAEEEPDKANLINGDAVAVLARAVKQTGGLLIHISTDYVFDGTSHTPLTEEDSCNPQGVYAKSKHAGEEEIIRINPKGAIIIRTSWIYSSFGQNFVHTMLRLGKEKDVLNVVSDQIGTPTYARDLAHAILSILAKKPILSKYVEIYHYSNEGLCSWYDFAQAIFEISNVNCKVSPISTKEYPTPAKRPLYSVLNKSKIINTYDLKIPYWKDSLKSCITLLNSNL